MAKYHINDRGEPGVCRARVGCCPFGDELEHYSTPHDAMTAFEKVMSGTTWTGFANGKPWGQRSWPSRKKELTDFILRQARNLFDRSDPRSRPEVVWTDIIEGNPRVFGQADWWGSPGDPTVTKVSITLTVRLENLSEEHAKEVVAHELAHLVVGHKHDDEEIDPHTEEWTTVAERLLASAGIDSPVFPQTALHKEELERLNHRSKVPLSARWVGKCPQGHPLNHTALRPPARAPCHKCNPLLPAYYTINWTNWRK